MGGMAVYQQELRASVSQNFIKHGTTISDVTIDADYQYLIFKYTSNGKKYQFTGTASAL